MKQVFPRLLVPNNKPRRVITRRGFLKMRQNYRCGSFEDATLIVQGSDCRFGSDSDRQTNL
ncbi:hypothetical protein EMIT0347P_10892 [Pseudomonas sp. IT-347P]